MTHLGQPKASFVTRLGQPLVIFTVLEHPFCYLELPMETSLGLLWAPCAGQFDPPGPMLENYRKTIKKTIFLESHFEAFSGRWHMQSVHACAVQTDILHLILTPFFERKKHQKIETVLDLRGGTCDTSKIRGELTRSERSGTIW